MNTSKKLIGFVVIPFSAFLLSTAEIKLHPIYCCVIFLLAFEMAMILHEIVHVLPYILNHIKIAGIICSPFVFVFFPKFKIRLMPLKFLFVGGEVIPDFSNNRIQFSQYCAVTNLSLLFAPMFSLFFSIISLILFYISQNAFYLFFFTGCISITVNSFSTDEDTFGDFAAYKNIKSEKNFFLAYYCNNLMIVHGGKYLHKMLTANSEILLDFEKKGDCAVKNRTGSYILFLYVTLMLAGYEFGDTTITKIDEIVRNLQCADSPNVTITTLRMLEVEHPDMNKEAVLSNIASLQFDNSIQSQYLLKQAETYYGLYDNTEYLLREFKTYLQSLDYHNLFFSGWFETEFVILKKCISLYKAY